MLISNFIEYNLKILSAHENEIRNFNGTIDGLKSLLYIPETELKTTKTNPMLKAFDKVKHRFSIISHYLTYYNPSAVGKRKVFSAQLKTKEDARKAIEDLVKSLQETANTYTEEKETITKASAKFAYFLKNNAITPYNDSLKGYMEHLIENQKNASNNEAIIRENINRLQKIIDEYEKEKKILEDAIALGNKESYDISPKEIFDLINELFNLQISGPKIKELHDLQESGIMSHNRQREVVHNVSDKKAGILEKLFMSYK